MLASIFTFLYSVKLTRYVHCVILFLLHFMLLLHFMILLQNCTDFVSLLEGLCECYIYHVITVSHITIGACTLQT